MNSQVLNTIKDALENITQLTPEKLQSLVQETMVAFQAIQSKVSSENEGDREEGIKNAMELKATMEEQVQKLQQKLGMSPEEIEEYIANPDNFSKEQYQVMDDSKKDLEKFRTNFEEAKVTLTSKKRNRRQHLIIG